jgi:hypothetical protein
MPKMALADGLYDFAKVRSASDAVLDHVEATITKLTHPPRHGLCATHDGTGLRLAAVGEGPVPEVVRVCWHAWVHFRVKAARPSRA